MYIDILNNDLGEYRAISELSNVVREDGWGRFNHVWRLEHGGTMQTDDVDTLVAAAKILFRRLASISITSPHRMKHCIISKH